MDTNILNEQLPDELKISQVAFSFHWKIQQMQYGDDLRVLIVGKIKVASFTWNSISGNKPDSRYMVHTEMSFLKKQGEVFKFATEQECADKCVELGKRFIKALQS